MHVMWHDRACYADNKSVLCVLCGITGLVVQITRVCYACYVAQQGLLVVHVTELSE